MAAAANSKRIKVLFAVFVLLLLLLATSDYLLTGFAAALNVRVVQQQQQAERRKHNQTIDTALHDSKTFDDDDELHYCSRSIMTTTESFCQCMAKLPSWLMRQQPRSSNIPLSFPLSLWYAYEPLIRQAALDSLNDCYSTTDLQGLNHTAFAQLTKHVFDALTPYRLKKSTKTHANPLVWQDILNIILLRRQSDPTMHHRHRHHYHHPPLKIAVFGGSVTEGTESAECPSNLNVHRSIMMNHTNQISCSWSQKLQVLLNAALGPNTVIVKNYAVGKMTSQIANLILNLDLVQDPDEQNYALSDFDIVISAFSANDGGVPGSNRDLVHTSMQQFVKTCQDFRPCHAHLPLVIQLEDILLDPFPSKQGGILGGLRFSREMVETANWASILSISYADAIRDYVYSHDPKKDTTLTVHHRVHPGMSFHIGVSWVIAWNLLQGLVSACDAPRMMTTLAPPEEEEESYREASMPLLQPSLRSNHMWALWNQSTRERTEDCASLGENMQLSRRRTQCVYKWVVSRIALNTADKVQEMVSTVATNIKGWKGAMYSQPTWLGLRVGATFTIQLDSVVSHIDHIVLVVSPLWL